MKIFGVSLSSNMYFLGLRSFLPFLCSAWRLLLLQWEIVYFQIRRQEFLRRWTVSLELSACYMTWQRHLTCTVYETFEDTLACLGLRRIVTVPFFVVYKYSYLLTYYFTDMSGAYERHYRKQITKIVQKLRVSCQRCTWRLHHQSAFWDASKVFWGFSFWEPSPPRSPAGALPPAPPLGAQPPDSLCGGRAHTFGGAPFHQFLDPPL